MADIIISPNMTLPVPTVSEDFGPDWANNLNSCLSAIDSHGHIPGQGVPITPAALNINSSLPMGNNQLTNTQAVVFTAQASLATLKAVYVIGVDLYYNDGSGNVIRITQSGSVSGASGTITGLPSGTASVSYQSVAQTYVFQSSTNTAANIDVRSIILRNAAASSFGLTLNPPAAMGSDISQTLPTIPGSTSFMTMSAAGAMGTSISTTNGITRTMQAAVGQQISSSCGSFTGSGNVFVDVTNLTVTITTTGRPVMIMCISDGTADASFSIHDSGANSDMNIAILRDVTTVSNQRLELLAGATATRISIPSSSITHLDPVSAGTYTYKVQVKTGNSSLGFAVSNTKLAAYEL